jgi:hypothetical protein
MEAVRTSETSVDNHFTRQYIPEDNSEHHTRRRENLKSHIVFTLFAVKIIFARLPAYILSGNNERIYIKFGIGGHEKLSWRNKFQLLTDATMDMFTGMLYPVLS